MPSRDGLDYMSDLMSIETTVRGLEGLDAVLQHRSRLGACVLLAQTDAMTFSRLKALLKETDGNLGAQMRKLEDAGYVTVRKMFENRRPVSWYRISGAGRKALRAHLKAMEGLLMTTVNEEE